MSNIYPLISDVKPFGAQDAKKHAQDASAHFPRKTAHVLGGSPRRRFLRHQRDDESRGGENEVNLF